MWELYLLLVPILVLSARVFTFYRDYSRGFSYMQNSSLKGPVKYPLLDHFHILLHLRSRPLEKLYEVLEIIDRGTGSIGLKFPGMPRWLVTSDPIILEHIHKTSYDKYKKEDSIKENLSGLLGTGIFAAEGDQWRLQRKIASSIFTVKNFRDFFVDVFRCELYHVKNHLDLHVRNGTVVDLHSLLHLFTLESFSRIGFGVNLNLISSPISETSNIATVLNLQDSLGFAQAFDKAQHIVDQRFFNPFWKWTERWDGTAVKFENYLKTMRSFTKTVISDRLQNGSDNGDDLLSRFINAQHKFTPSELHDIIINFVIAGRDTTAQTISWSIFSLMENPHVIQKIREEVSLKLGDKQLEDVSYEDLQSLKYVKAVFSETLRLHSAVPKQAKVSVEDDVWPDGTIVKKGDWVVWSSWLMGRLESVWGPDAKEFKPERFIECPQPSQFKYPVFNMGPRLCLGMNMAYLEGVLALAILVRDFDFVAKDMKEIMYGNALTLPMKYGLNVYVKRRE